MAGTTALIQPTKHVCGPMKIFGPVGLPANNAKATLAADGTPDSTASPTAKYLGGTKKGGVFTRMVKMIKERNDEVTSNVRLHVTEDDISIEAELTDLADTAILAKIDSTSTLFAGSGFNLLQVGGTIIVPVIPLIAIAQNIADPTKYDYCIIYAAYSEGGLSIPFTISQDGSQKVKFSGLYVSGRPAGDQVGHIGIGV